MEALHTLTAGVHRLFVIPNLCPLRREPIHFKDFDPKTLIISDHLMKNKKPCGTPRKAARYQYFLTAAGDAAYRAVVRFSKARHDFVVVKVPELFNEVWQASTRYPSLEEFVASIDTGVVRKASLLEACVAVDADAILFAPTKSSRLASKQAAKQQ